MSDTQISSHQKETMKTKLGEVAKMSGRFWITAISAVNPLSSFGAIGLALLGKKVIPTPSTSEMAKEEICKERFLPEPQPREHTGEAAWHVASSWVDSPSSPAANLFSAAVKEVLSAQLGWAKIRIGRTGTGSFIDETRPTYDLLDRVVYQHVGYIYKPVELWHQLCQIVEDTYVDTQKNLMQDTYTLYRGIAGDIADELRAGKKISCRTIESWTDNYGVAARFAESAGKKGVVISKVFRKEDIFTTYILSEIADGRDDEWMVVTNEILEDYKVEDTFYSSSDEQFYYLDNNSDEEEDIYDGDAFDGEGFITPVEIERRRKAQQNRDRNQPCFAWYGIPHLTWEEVHYFD